MSKKRSTSTRRSESEAASARAAAIRAEQERMERRRRSLVVSGVVVLVLAILLVVGYAVQSRRDDTSTSAAAPAGAVSGLAVPAGKASAPVKVTVYEDFMCPFCGDFEAGASAFTEDIAAGRVQFQYHVLNFLDDASSTDYSTRAANALAVVLDTSGQTVAKRYHDLLFENQPEENTAGLSDGQLVDLAVRAGAKESEVQPGIDSLSFEGWVKKVADQASKDEVNSTPTVLVDGKAVEAETIDEMVQEVRTAVDAGQ